MGCQKISGSSGDGCTALGMYLMPLNCILKDD